MSRGQQQHQTYQFTAGELTMYYHRGMMILWCLLFVQSRGADPIFWLKDEDDSVVETISKRAELMTGLTMNSAEPLQVGNYGIGGHYVPHWDHIHARDIAIHGYHSFYTPEMGNRAATILFYMSQPLAGGGTVFPMLGVSVEAVKNAAVFWYNVKHNGEGDDLTLHAGCPVLGGLKWVANKWIHERQQEFRRPCSLTNGDYD